MYGTGPVENWIPFVWKRGYSLPFRLPFDDAIVYSKSRRGDLAGDRLVLDPIFTNEMGEVYYSGDILPFLFRDGMYLDLDAIVGGIAVDALVNRRGDALIVPGKRADFTPQRPLVWLSRDGTNTIPVPNGWSVWVSEMGSDSFRGEFTVITPEYPAPAGSFVYREGSFINVGRTNETETVLRDMNDRGDCVGYAAFADTVRWPEDLRGFIYQDGQRRFLDEIVPNTQDWVLFPPMAINNCGNIAGLGFRNGRLSIYLLNRARSSAGKTNTWNRSRSSK